MNSNLVKWSGLAAIVAGLLFVIADLLSLPIVSYDFGEALLTDTYAVQSIIKLLAAALLVFGLFGLYASQSEAAGALGLVSFLVAFVGTLMMVGAFWAAAFLAPAVAAGAPEFAAQNPAGRHAAGFGISWALFIFGWLLFGVATLQARVYPRVAAILLIIGSVPVLGTLLVVGFPSTSIVFSAALVWLGFVLWTGRSTTAAGQSTQSS